MSLTSEMASKQASMKPAGVPHCVQTGELNEVRAPSVRQHLSGQQPQSTAVPRAIILLLQLMLLSTLSQPQLAAMLPIGRSTALQILCSRLA